MITALYVIGAIAFIAVIYKRVAEWDRAHQELEARRRQR